jgi:hypothetical protein
MRGADLQRVIVGVGMLVVLIGTVGLSVESISAVTVPGGGSKQSDCLVVFEAPGANTPAPPKAPRHVDCIDGDMSCDADGSRNGRCVVDLQVCVNSTAVEGCSPVKVDAVEVAHAIDDGDRRFDPDFQALQQRLDLLGFPDNDVPDLCTISSALTVVLKGPTGSGKMKKNKKRVKLTALGFAGGGFPQDRDRMKFTCRPEGDAIYEPRDLYEGTFDRIRQQVFAQSCAISACHDSESSQGGLILLPNAAYSQIVGVAPSNPAAAVDGLLRVTAADPDLSFLYRKIADDLEPGYGVRMPQTGAPLSGDLTELIRLWIIGDGTLGPAPETGWVVGTDN